MIADAIRDACSRTYKKIQDDAWVLDSDDDDDDSGDSDSDPEVQALRRMSLSEATEYLQNKTVGAKSPRANSPTIKTSPTAAMKLTSQLVTTSAANKYEVAIAKINSVFGSDDLDRVRAVLQEFRYGYALSRVRLLL